MEDACIQSQAHWQAPAAASIAANTLQSSYDTKESIYGRRYGPCECYVRCPDRIVLSAEWGRGLRFFRASNVTIETLPSSADIL